MNKKIRARDKRLYYFYDNNGYAHMGSILGGKITDDTSRLAFFSFDKGVLSVENDQNGNKCAVYGKTRYQLKDGMPLPNYNDGYGVNGQTLEPNLVEKIGLYRYQKLFTRFYAGKGITMIEASKSIDIKNDLLKSRMSRQPLYLAEIEKRQNNFERKKEEHKTSSQLLDNYVFSVMSAEDKLR